MMKIQPPTPPENIWVTRAGCSLLLVWIGLITVGLVGLGWGHDYPSPANEEWRNFPKVHVRDDLRLGNSNITPATLGIISDGDGRIDNADGQHTHDVSGLITGITDVVYLTDDRGPGWWAVGSDVFSASLTYPTRMLEKVQVNGYSWPLVADAGHVAYEYRDDDSTMLAGFTLRRSTAMTALSVKANRVEWFYLSSEFNPEADVANGLWPVRAEPVGAVFNSVEY
jgi:hypothetical protein